MKKALIILPGWGGSKKTWKEFISLAEQEVETVFCMELPCFGDEPCPSDAWGIQEYAQFVKKKIELFNHENPDAEKVLLGHSFGGQVAVHLLASDNRLVDKLILVGAAVVRPRKVLKRSFFFLLAKIGNVIFSLPIVRKAEPLARKVLYKITGSSDYRYTDGIKKAIFQKVTRQDVTHELEIIKNKTLVLWGEKDRHTPLRFGKRIAALLSDASFVMLQGIKHCPHRESPQEMMSVIKKFIYS